ncbi:MAG: Tad domain-containing protein [Massilia sp.]
MIAHSSSNTAGKRPRPARQDGAVAVMVALLLLMLLGLMGIALDFGRVFIVRTELQTAMDSCALAAAQELDGQASALPRARSAGLTAANLNRVNLQSASWDGKGQLTSAEITFKDAAYADTTAATARYAMCSHSQTGVKMWLLHLIAATGGSAATAPTTRSVLASAVASRASSQSTCPVPVAIKARTGGTAPNYGFQVGEWVTVYDKGGASAGEMGWYNLDGSKSASETANELAEGGSCGTRVGDVLGTPGAQTSVDKQWNFRFGIYKNGESAASNHPDQTGYSYTSFNWKNAVPQNAFSGTPAAGSAAGIANYVSKRAAYASFDDTGTDLKDGALLTYGDKNKLNSFKNIASPGVGGEHQRYGYARRLVVVPVIDGSSKVTDYVCMLMLAPMTGPNDTVQMEFRGNAGNTASPCTTNGLPGGSAGPLVPVLVR